MESILQHGQFALSTTLSSTVTSWCDLTVSCADVGLHTRVTWCSAFKFCVLPTQVALSATSPQVQMAPPTLSQVTFCQLRLLRLPRSSPLLHSWSVASLLMLPCRPSYQSPLHLWMPPRRLFHTSLSLETFLRNSRSGSSWLHLLRTMFSAPRVLHQSPRYLLMRLCRRLCTASQLMMPPHNYRSRSSSSGVSSPMILWTAKLCHRHTATLVAPHRHNLLTLLRIAAPAAPAMLATVTSTLRPHMSYYCHHRVSRSMPVNTPHMVYLLKRRRCDLVYVRSQSHVSVPPKWEHILCAELLPSREVQVPP